MQDQTFAASRSAAAVASVYRMSSCDAGKSKRVFSRHRRGRQMSSRTRHVTLEDVSLSAHLGEFPLQALVLVDDVL